MIGITWADQTEVLSDLGFRKRGEEPVNWRFCQHGQRNDRMMVERVFSLVTVVNHLKKALKGKLTLSKRGGSSARAGTRFAEKRLYLRRFLAELNSFSRSVFPSGQKMLSW